MTEGTGWFSHDAPLSQEPAQSHEPAQTFPEAKGNVSIPTERDALLNEAIRAGKFTEKRRAHYAAMYDKDPVGTRKLISSLASAHASERAKPDEGTGWF